MLLHELWDDPEDEGRYTFCLSGLRGADARALLSSSARLVWTVEAASHFDAMTAYYEHQGWGVYTTDQEWDHKTYVEHGWENDGQPARGAESQAAHLTRMLRRSGDPLFARIRDLLPECGVDVETVVLAQFFPDDGDQEFGVLVTTEREVFTFVLYMGRRGDLKAQLQSSKIGDWNDITRTWETSAYRRYVKEALALPEGWDQ
ncbi:hypothetical protein [Nocardioides marmoriginsengisoli]|uniref:hypothetical protein n=1 Tax=Nocardioides marmoriginsengisoli TaxID=661483 RepID=UPI001C832F8E|nr:hypothetical protein [Nocardioides marmoriginsengisoli]